MCRRSNCSSWRYWPRPMYHSARAGNFSEPGTARRTVVGIAIEMPTNRHLSSGETAATTSPLAPTVTRAPHPTTAAPSGAMAPVTAPMMGPMIGEAAGAGSGGGRLGSPQHSGEKPKRVAYSPQRRDTSAELRDFGANLKGLEHATDQQLIAASIAAGLLRAHRRRGIFTGVAVEIRGSEAPVFATSDGLGFLPPEMKADGHLRPLVTAVPDDFMLRWLGCDQPWRPLLEAAGLGMVGPFDAVVATDPAAGTHGVLVLTTEQVDAVNITGGSAQRWELDAIDVGDVDDVVAYLCRVWGRPVQAPVDLEFRVAGLVAETTGFTAASSAATATAAAVAPPGNDADSFAAIAQHGTTTANFVAMLGAGIEQLSERAAETTTNNPTFQGLQLAGSSALSTI
jgi:hypothetical protein